MRSREGLTIPQEYSGLSALLEDPPIADVITIAFGRDWTTEDRYWASQFVCSNCGPMDKLPNNCVTTKKTCLECECKQREHYLLRGFPCEVLKTKE